MKKKKIAEASSGAAPKGSGFFRSHSGGQELSLRQMTTEERADFLAELAAGNESGFGGIEDTVISLVRASPDFSGADGGARRELALGILTLFEQLSDEEADTAAMLHSLCSESQLDDSRWGAVQLSLMPEEYRASVREIALAEQNEKEAIGRGEARDSGRQMPFLLCEHARRIVREREYLNARSILEKALWDVDEDDQMARICRSGLDIALGRRGYQANAIVDSLARARIEELGLGGAIAEVAGIWKALRSQGVDEKTIRDAIFAFGHTYDEGVEPTFGALNILSEISQSGMSMIDPKLTIMAAARKLSPGQGPSGGPLGE